jgi:hypothetical protein
MNYSETSMSGNHDVFTTDKECTLRLQFLGRQKGKRILKTDDPFRLYIRKGSIGSVLDFGFRIGGRFGDLSHTDALTVTSFTTKTL